MNPFIVEAKRILGPALAAATKSTMQGPFGRTGVARAPSASVPAVVAAFVVGAALMVLLAPEGRARAADVFRRFIRRTPQQAEAGMVQPDLADERPSGAME
jgi:hypothetical protein